MLYRMEFINYRDSPGSDIRSLPFQKHISHVISCCNSLVTDLYWLIQRDEHNSRTIDLLYSTVYL